MLRKLQRSRCEGFPSELPGEAAAGEGLAAVAGPSPALCQPRTGQRNWGPVPPQFLYLGATPHQRHQVSIDIIRISLGGVRESCCLMPFGRVGPAPYIGSPAELASPCLAPFLQGTAPPCSTWPLFLQALRHFCSVRGPRLRSASLRSVLGKNAAEPSGQPGSSRPGCWRSVCLSAFPKGTLAARHTLRRRNPQCKAFGHQR